MENKITYDRPAEKHPAVQNLRWFFREFANNGGSVKSFAQRMGIRERNMGAYLRGYYKPKEVTIRHWATLLGVDYEYMTTVEFDYIPYPLPVEPKKKKSGRHITMSYHDGEIEAINSECKKVCEDNDIDYALFQDVFDKHRNYRKKPSRS